MLLLYDALGVINFVVDVHIVVCHVVVDHLTMVPSACEHYFGIVSKEIIHKYKMTFPMVFCFLVKLTCLP